MGFCVLVSLWRYRLSGHGVIYNGQTEKGNLYQDFQALGQDRCAYYVIKFVVSYNEQQKNYIPFQWTIRDWLNSDGTLGEGVVATDVSRGAFY